MKEITLTNTGKLGDFLYCLPVASWLARERGCKIHWVLPSCFGPFNYVQDLLMLQPFTSRVSLVSFKVKNYDCGGQPYRFDPTDYVTVHGPFYNLGFRGSPDKFVSAFYAEEHGFGYDRDFRLEIHGRGCAENQLYDDYGLGAEEPSPTYHRFYESGEVLRTREGAMSKLAPRASVLPPAEDLLALTYRLACAKEVHTWYCGIAVLCWFAGIRATVYRAPGHAPVDLYFSEPRSLTFCEVTL